jgi:hypothetical protein
MTLNGTRSIIQFLYNAARAGTPYTAPKEINTTGLLLGLKTRKQSFGISTSKSEDNIKMDLRKQDEVDCNGSDSEVS